MREDWLKNSEVVLKSCKDHRVFDERHKEEGDDNKPCKYCTSLRDTNDKFYFLMLILNYGSEEEVKILLENGCFLNRTRDLIKNNGKVLVYALDI